MENSALIGDAALFEHFISHLKGELDLVLLRPVDVVAEVVHVSGGRIWHIRKLSQLWEEGRLQVIVNLLHHLQSARVVRNCSDDLVEARTVVMREVQHHVL